ncbi:MAG: hypothetical protein GXY23_09865 [Myxococcales bacterium]|nr:hypothetical protein [Myxococcales bacterium]
MRRLPQLTPVDEVLEVPLDAPRAELPGHLFGVVAASAKLDGAAFLESLLGALRAQGVDPAVEHLPARPGEAIAGLEARLRRHPVCITVGALGVALFRPKIALLYTGGLSSTGFSEAARALRPRFDLELPEARPGLFSALAGHPRFSLVQTRVKR